MTMTFRQATPADVAAMHRLISDNLELGHLLPRTLDDLIEHAARFLVAERGRGDRPAPSSRRSARAWRRSARWSSTNRRGDAYRAAACDGARRAAPRRGFSTLCAFTHDPSHFVRLGFTIVPHIWVPEKIARDCTVLRAVPPLRPVRGHAAAAAPACTCAPTSRRR